jgi:positive regulator of sigma E activity
MTFDDLQSTWQSHNHGMPLNVDTNVLMREVRQNHRVFERQLLCRDLSEIIAALLITVVFASLAVLLGQWTLFLCAAGSLIVGSFFLVDRLKQRQRRSTIANTLLLTVDAAIEEEKHQIRLLRNILWWYLLPLIPGIGLFLASVSWQSRANGFAEQIVIAVVAAICAIAFWLVYWINQREIRKTLEPRRQELEELRSRITSSNSDSDESPIICNT